MRRIRFGGNSSVDTRLPNDIYRFLGDLSDGAQEVT